jgi:hypothetical protein
MTMQRKAGGQELWVAIAAYVVWSYANGGFFNAMGWWYPVPAGIIALAFAGLLKFFPQPTK